MRGTLVCAFVLALWGAGVVTPAQEPGFLLEYRRVRPSGEEIELAVDAAGVVTGSVRPVGAAGPGEKQVLDVILPLDPALPRLLRAAGFWEGTPAAATAGSTVRIHVQEGTEVRTVAGSDADLAAGSPLAGWAGACEVLTGAALALARGWRARGEALEKAGQGEAAAEAYVEGIARVPRVFSVRGPNPRTQVEHFRKNSPPGELASHIRYVFESEIGLVAQTLERGEQARCAPEERLWPDDGHPGWPWDEKAIPSDWEIERLSPREEPTPGPRDARPNAGDSPAEGGKTDWSAVAGLGAPLGTLTVGSAPAGTAVEFEFAWGESAGDPGWSERLERHVAQSGARRVRTLQYRRPTRRLIDVLARRGGDLERWVVVQSGKNVALVRATGRLAAMRAAAPDLVRVLASLEPQPPGAHCAAEARRETALVADRSVRFELPADWTEQPAPGAPRKSAFVDARPPDADASLRLALRVVGEPLLFNPGAFWKSVVRPGPDAACAGLPQTSESIARVRSLGCGWADLTLVRVPFGAEVLPVITFALAGPERVVAGAVVCGRDDPALIARARALAEQIAGSATAE